MLTTEKWHVRIFVTMVTRRRHFLSSSGQKHAEIGIELGLPNVLDNFSFYFVFSIKNEGVIKFLQK